MIRYAYDSWGKAIAQTDSTASEIGTLNPFRYRSYIYDTETGLYYLKARYYDPEVGRFINADVLMSTGQGVLGCNMFCYCLNNPVNMTDESGCACVRTSNIMMTDGAGKNNEYWDVYMRNYTIIGSTKVPFLGKPNSYYKSPDGRVERWYGADGRPIKDKHNDNHGNPKTHPVVPHFHDWNENENGEWRPGKWYSDYSYLDEKVRIPIMILPYPGFDAPTTVGIPALSYFGFDGSTTTVGGPAFSYGFATNPWLQLCK